MKLGNVIQTSICDPACSAGRMTLQSPNKHAHNQPGSDGVFDYEHAAALPDLHQVSRMCVSDPFCHASSPDEASNRQHVSAPGTYNMRQSQVEHRAIFGRPALHGVEKAQANDARQVADQPCWRRACLPNRRAKVRARGVVRGTIA